MNLDLDNGETAALVELADAIELDRFPLSPRHKCWRSILAKLSGGTTYAGPLYPAPKAPGEPSFALQRKRRR
jgi:hypothetical protein